MGADYGETLHGFQGGCVITLVPEPTARSAVRRGLPIPPRLFTPGETKALAKSKVHQISRAWVTNDGRWVVIVTDLKNMADRQEWKGQRFKKIYVRKITQHEEMFFKLSFIGMIKFYLNMEHDQVYGKFVLTVCICSILYFCIKIC